ncbi:MAG: ABC transporter ATP-binding protein [Cellulomonadaceae bacterium]|jgi:iron complex transport system ATP-binding protein|nr:ABC transporter ATP-binding protein [Cellulomonadaceae bacterium]
MTTVLALTNVTVRRGDTTILDDVTWQVNDGERWVLFGPNGAGKTTTIKLAATRMYPTTGTVDILGERLGSVDVRELRQSVGVSSVAIADEIPFEEKVRDVVLTAAWGVTGRWKENYDDYDVERAHDLLAAFGVAHLSDRRYGTLSGGERKRVQIARALMTYPELLLLDEPGAGLDLGGREDLVASLTELADNEAAPVIVLVTHHVEEIPPGFTHMLLMAGGKVAARGPIDQVLTSDNLTAAFGTPLVVTHDDGRWIARGAPTPRMSV